MSDELIEPIRERSIAKDPRLVNATLARAVVRPAEPEISWR
jgi:hypothetical protein